MEKAKGRRWEGEKIRCKVQGNRCKAGKLEAGRQYKKQQTIHNGQLALLIVDSCMLLNARAKNNENLFTAIN
jgi:hypothetical protein